MSNAPLLPRSFPFGSGHPLWRAGAVIVATGMMAGAFGAHGLRRRPNISSDQVHAWETASTYAIMNGLGAMLVSMHPRFASHRFAGPAIIAGTLIFSGSIYALTLNREKLRFLGPVTPLGGILMMAGWLSLAF